jgi:hypothetical protein
LPAAGAICLSLLVSGLVIVAGSHPPPTPPPPGSFRYDLPTPVMRH